MTQIKKHVSAGGTMLALGVLLIAIVLEAGYTVNANWYWALLVLIPILVVANKNRSGKDFRPGAHTKSSGGWRPSARFSDDKVRASAGGSPYEGRHVTYSIHLKKHA